MSILFAMFSFSLAMSISPGPVNMVIVSSGANYGLRRTFPFVSGATIGFTLLLLFIGLGFLQFVQTYPMFLKYLAIAGSLFIIYMGYKLISAKPELDIPEQNVPKFHEGFLLQWLNPKAWIACVSGASLFSTTEGHQSFLIFSTIYFIVCYLCLGAWAVLGDRVTFLREHPRRLRVFNICMGALLILTAIYLVYLQLFLS
ncbi:LysE family translocator [Algicola sagamiensis]|uniref:LysE family translocator n=1 Tax=Algicola sagamiensis TaxID=163869 RepID=UPI00036DF7CC|nr:LysE family translocator [Algicola sagamiensis]